MPRLRLPSFRAPEGGLLRARPRFLAMAALALLAGLLVSGLLLAPSVWPASGAAPASDPQSVADSGLFALRLEGDLLSGEATDLVRTLERSVGRVERSFLDEAPTRGSLLGELPDGRLAGLVLVRPGSGDLAQLDALTEAAARQFPGISAAASLPWSHAVTPPVRFARLLLSVRWALLPLLLLLLLYPLLESFSRLQHLVRSMQDTAAVMAGVFAGSVLALLLAGVMADSGVGHGPMLLPAALLGAMTGGILPILWERWHAVASEERPAVEGASRALLLALLLALPLLLVGLLLAWAPGSPPFGAEMLQPALAGAALMASALTVSSLRILSRRPSTPRERSISAVSEWLLTLSPLLGRLVRFPLPALAVALLLAVTVTLGPAAAGRTPDAPPTGPQPVPSVLLALSARSGPVPAASAAGFLEMASEQPWLSSGRELFGASASDSTVVFSFEADPSLSPAGLERAAASLPLPDGLTVRAAGGSYRAWGEWSASFPLAAYSSALLVLLASAAATALFGHLVFRFARAGLLLAAPAVATAMVHAPGILSGDPPAAAFTLSFLITAVWTALFGVEFARDCDAGSDGRAASREAWLAASPLALFLAPLLLALPGLPAVLLLQALVGTVLLSLPLAAVIGPRQSLRF